MKRNRWYKAESQDQASGITTGSVWGGMGGGGGWGVEVDSTQQIGQFERRWAVILWLLVQ